MDTRREREGMNPSDTRYKLVVVVALVCCFNFGFGALTASSEIKCTRMFEGENTHVMPSVATIDRIVDNYFVVVLMSMETKQHGDNTREDELVVSAFSPVLNVLHDVMTEGMLGYIRSGKFIPDDARTEKVRDRIRTKMHQLRLRLSR